MEFTSLSRMRHCDVKSERPDLHNSEDIVCENSQLRALLLNGREVNHTERSDLHNSEDIVCENSQLRALLMNGREINHLKIKTEEISAINSLDIAKKELNTLVFDKDLYYKELKAEANENCSIKNEENGNNFDMDCNISYADFQLTNEEIVVKQECNTRDGFSSLTPNHQNVEQETVNTYQKCVSTIDNYFRLHSGSSQVYSCTECDFQTKYKRSLQKHHEKHKAPTEVVLYKCTECSYMTKYKNNLGYHMLIHLDKDQVKMYNCEHCTYQTKRKGHLNSHMKLHLDNATMYQCDKCEYKTKHPGCLKKHVVSHLKIDEADTVYQCTYCSHKTKNKTRLVKHEKLHLRPIKSREFKCYHCNYQTNNKYLLSNHLKTHRQQKLKCEYCSYETVKEGKLIAHKKVHINVK